MAFSSKTLPKPGSGVAHGRASEADAEDRHPARWLGLAAFGLGLGLLPLSRLRLLIVAGDHHGPIGAIAGAFGTGDADLGGFRKQQIFAVARRGDPLVERPFEIDVAIGDVLGGPT